MKHNNVSSTVKGILERPKKILHGPWNKVAAEVNNTTWNDVWMLIGSQINMEMYFFIKYKIKEIK